jgi:hypothetical protein
MNFLEKDKFLFHASEVLCSLRRYAELINMPWLKFIIGAGGLIYSNSRAFHESRLKHNPF